MHCWKFLFKNMYSTGNQWGVFISLVVLFPFTAACTKSMPKNDTARFVARGKAVYVTSCAACHHSDPKKDGPLGPAAWGASRDLLNKRIKEAGYPTGYTPKRDTKLMQPLPHISDEDIQALFHYLNHK
jgi:mono/diheme cytochrome c family protein